MSYHLEDTDGWMNGWMDRWIKRMDMDGYWL